VYSVVQLGPNPFHQPQSQNIHAKSECIADNPEVKKKESGDEAQTFVANPKAEKRRASPNPMLPIPKPIKWRGSPNPKSQNKNESLRHIPYLPSDRTSNRKRM
jgi:hypothetical protein